MRAKYAISDAFVRDCALSTHSVFRPSQFIVTQYALLCGHVITHTVLSHIHLEDAYRVETNYTNIDSTTTAFSYKPICKGFVFDPGIK